MNCAVYRGRMGDLMKQAVLNRKRAREPHLGERTFPRLMLAPTLVVMAILTAYPLIFTFVYSFTDYQYLKGAENASFVALKNYTDLIQNVYFRQAVWNTVKFTILAVFFEMVFGLLIAVFINSLKRGQKVMRTLLLLPYLLPAVTVALSWRMMLSSNYGIINQVLESLQLPVFNGFIWRYLFSANILHSARISVCFYIFIISLRL